MLCFVVAVRKVLQMLWKANLIFTRYIFLKNAVLTNISNKYVIRKINLYFFDVMKNDQIFSSNVCHFQYDHRFFFSREMGIIRMRKELRLQRLVYLVCQDSTRLGIYQVAYKWRIIWEEFLFPIFLKIFWIETSNVCFKNFQIFDIALCHLLTP